MRCQAETAPTPAEIVIARFGSAQRVAEALGVHVSRVHRWAYPRERGGSDGMIPSRHHRPLLDAAKAAGIKLKADDLIPRGTAGRAA